jgi:prephenate dehydrogenase
MFRKVAIIGPGLIGGSLGMALHRDALVEQVVGIGRRQSSLDLALQVGAIDTATLDMAAGLADADLVVLAPPSQIIERMAPEIAPLLAEGATLIDVASSKVGIVRDVTAALADRPDVAYVPTHPMAGSEQTGPLAATPDLFEGSVCIVTPLPDTPPPQLDAIVVLWTALGAEVVDMTPEEHDRLVARISHVPHLAASALMHIVDPATMHCGGGGLRDTTRIAASSPDLWMGIYTANRAEIHQALSDYIGTLQAMMAALDDDDQDALRALLATAQARRRELDAD